MQPTLLDRLLLIADLFERDAQRAYAGTTLSTARMHVLWVLHHEGPVTQQSLAQSLDVTPRNISGLVDALETTQFVRRATHPGDRRAHLIELTDGGRALMEKTTREHAELSSTLLDAIEPRDREAVLRGLDAVSARFGQLLAEALGADDRGLET